MVLVSKKNPNLNLKDPFHFIGIGGSGMSALAELAFRRGLQVRGSDTKSSIVTDRLAALGIKIALEHKASAVEGARTVIRSSAIQDTNPEILAAKQLDIPVIHRSDLLASLMQNKQAITVAGTHGKSTTSAMVVHMLSSLGLDPEAALGGAMRQYQSSARSGNGDFFVAEADESDGSFLRYDPFCAVVTNIDQDHMEYFRSAAGLEQAFSAHLNKIHPDGFAVVGWDSPILRGVAQNVSVRRITFGFVLGSDVRALGYRCNQGETFFTAIVERDQVECKLPTIGRHNVQNALAVLAVARGLDLDVTAAAASLASFPGVERRMNLVHKSEDVALFDDYAHNPGKIAACVQALRDSFQDWQIHVIFQPHRYSRLETMYHDMLKAVSSADLVHMLPVYSAGETSEQDFSPARLASDLKSLYGVSSVPCENFESVTNSVMSHLKPPAVVLTVGAGDVWKAARLLKGRLE